MTIAFPRFEQQLAAKQLQKGKFYFEEELVCNLHQATSGCWNADVSGKNDYRVQVTIEKEEIVKTYCDCPHEVDFCKHVVAVLYAIAAEAEKERMSDAAADFSQLVLNIPEEKLRRLVAEYGKTDLRLQAFFRAAAEINSTI